MTKVYAFEYSPHAWEMGCAIVSLHDSKLGAYRAMMKHKCEQWAFARELRFQYDDSFGIGQHWKVRELEVLHTPEPPPKPRRRRNFDIYVTTEDAYDMRLAMPPKGNRKLFVFPEIGPLSIPLTPRQVIDLCELLWLNKDDAQIVTTSEHLVLWFQKQVRSRVFHHTDVRFHVWAKDCGFYLIDLD